MSQKDIIQGMREIAKAVLPSGADAFLFGSRARGDARLDSDWDVLILIDGERATGADFDKYAYPFVNYGWSIGEQIILSFTRSLIGTIVASVLFIRMFKTKE